MLSTSDINTMQIPYVKSTVTSFILGGYEFQKFNLFDRALRETYNHLKSAVSLETILKRI